jgi:hypothetical protein
MIGGVNYNSYSEALRKMGQIIIEVSQINTPKLTISDAELDEEATVTDWVELAQDTDYWVAWTDIQETVREHTPHHEVSYDLYSESFYTGLYSSISAELLSGEQRIGLLDIEYSGYGEAFIMGEYRHPYTETWDILYNGIPSIDNIDALTIGRRISSLELSYLAAETGSCAAALDFWQTHPETGWYSQSEWADLRGVNRQTVNDRRRDAREQLKQD